MAITPAKWLFKPIRVLFGVESWGPCNRISWKTPILLQEGAVWGQCCLVLPLAAGQIAHAKSPAGQLAEMDKLLTGQCHHPQRSLITIFVTAQV